MKRKAQIPLRAEVERIGFRYHPIEGRAGKLRLDFNENTVGCSPRVLAVLRRTTREQAAMYPEYDAARRELARSFGVRAGELLITNGADDGLRLVSDAYIGRGDRVLVVEPTFPIYRFYPGMAGAKFTTLHYDAEMRFPLDEVLRELRRRKPRAFFLANPNNPTGTLVERPALRRILDAAPRTVVILDEAYSEFSGVTAKDWIRRYPHLVITRTFSKGAGLAGLRIGVVLAARETIAAMRRAHAPFPVNSLAVAAALAAVKDKAYIRGYVAEVKRSRAALAQFLAARGVKVYPSAANFMLADFGAARAPRMLRGLAQQGILLRDRTSDFGRPGYVRITLGTMAQTRRLLRALRGLL